MNILLYVMTMLMLLALMTFGRLESFRSFAFIQAQFKTYMEKTERAYVNEQARKRYQDTKASTRDGQKHETNQASSKLSFNLFVDREQRLAHQAELESHISVARNLMAFLYGDQPFFIEMEEQRPDFMNEIFASLIAVTEELTGREKLNSKKVKEIATLDLGDPALNDVFTKMLKGSVEVIEETDVEEDPFQPVEEQGLFKPERGYYSLLDFITIQKNKLVIRIYLASPQLLMALYGNPSLVQQIIEERYVIYRQLMNNEITPEQGRTQLEAQFQNLQLEGVPPGMLDFGVSKTNPNTYL